MSALAGEHAPVRVRGLGRRFGARTALDDVRLDVRAGEIVGLVGPNGSGKTTLMKILAGFVRPHAGEVRLFGLEPFARRAEVMERVRFAFAPPRMFESLTPREHLHYLAGLGGGPRGSHAELEATLELVGLAQRADERVRTFSHGMRQRLALAQALLPRPELLVLDEPTDGLDPVAVLELREILLRLRDEHGAAVLVSSHLLVEIDRLVDRMLVLVEGREVFTGTPAELARGAGRLRLQVDRPARARELLTARGLAVEPAVESAVAVNGGADAGELVLPAGALLLAEAEALLRAGGVVLQAFHETRPSAEAALLAKLRTPGPGTRSDPGATGAKRT